MHFFSTYANMGFPDAVATAKEALKREEFAILAEIDIRQMLKRNLSVDLRPYVVLIASNPPLVHRAIKADDAIGSMLLCEMVIQEHSENCVEFSVLDPACTIGTVNHIAMISIAEELQSRVRKVMDDIASGPKSIVSHRVAGRSVPTGPRPEPKAAKQ